MSLINKNLFSPLKCFTVFDFCIRSQARHGNIPLQMVVYPEVDDDSVSNLKRLDADTEEFCCKLFAYSCLAKSKQTNGYGPRLSQHFGSPESLHAMVQHVPELMTVADEGFGMSLGAVLVGRNAYVCNVEKKEPLLVASCSETVELLMALPTSTGAAFDAEVEEACKVWCDLHPPMDDDVLLEKVLGLVETYRKQAQTQAQAWRSREFWVTACVQLGLSPPHFTDVAKKQCL